jgi:putative transposase
MAFVLRRCRELYNAALQERRDAWRMCRVSITLAGQSAHLPDITQERPEYQDLHSQVLQEVLTRLDRAFQAFFRRVKNGEQPGYPRCKCGTRSASFTYKQFGTGATLDNGYLVLSQIGRLAVRWRWPLEGTPKTLTIGREADGWYACCSGSDVPIKPLPLTSRETGVDRGLESFATVADGSQIANPRILRVAQMHLKRAQRRGSRRQKGSHRSRKAVKILAKAPATVRRARQDFHHKRALVLVHRRQYDTLSHEDVQPAHLVQNHLLAKSISDAGWSGFLAILSFKAVEAGKAVVAVPAAFTSQAGSGGGVLVAKGWSVRWHACPECGTELHRAHHAARNILARGKERSGAGQAPQALTPPVGADVAGASPACMPGEGQVVLHVLVAPAVRMAPPVPEHFFTPCGAILAPCLYAR